MSTPTPQTVEEQLAHGVHLIRLAERQAIINHVRDECAWPAEAKKAVEHLLWTLERGYHWPGDTP